jgi:hypothetical protein
MNAIAVAADTVLSSAIITAEFNVMCSTLDTSVQIAAQSNIPEVSIDKSGGSSSGVSLTAGIVDVERWSAEKNVRYKELSRNEALGQLSVEELAELDSLTRLRRFKKYPRSAEEILWQRHQQKLTRNLVQALQTYVEFHETSRSP